MFSHYATRKISPICKISTFLKTSVFSTLGATLIYKNRAGFHIYLSPIVSFSKKLRQDKSYQAKYDMFHCLNNTLLHTVFRCLYLGLYTATKMKFSINDFLSKCDQIRSFLRFWSHLLKKFLMENFIFCAVLIYFCNKIVISIFR